MLVRVDHVGNRVEQRRSFGRGRATVRAEGPIGSPRGYVDLLGIRRADRSDGGAGGRIDHVDRWTITLDQLTVDQ